MHYFIELHSKPANFIADKGPSRMDATGRATLSPWS